MRMRRCWSVLSSLIPLSLLLLGGCSTEPRVVAVRRFNASPATVSAPEPSRRPGYYRVKPGDTLYSIAFRHQMDYRELARFNGIVAPYTIYPGQWLRVRRASRSRVHSLEPAPAAPATATVAQVAPSTHAAASGAAWPAPPPAMSAGRPPASASVSASVPVAGAAVVAAGGPERTVDGIAWRWPVHGPILAGFEADVPGRQGLDIGGRMGEPVYAAAAGVVVYSGSGLTGYGELVIIKHNEEYLSAYGHNSVRLVKEGQRVVAGQEIAEMGNTGSPRVELHFEIRRNGHPMDPTAFLPRR